MNLFKSKLGSSGSEKKNKQNISLYEHDMKLLVTKNALRKLYSFTFKILEISQIYYYSLA